MTKFRVSFVMCRDETRPGLPWTSNVSKFSFLLQPNICVTVMAGAPHETAESLRVQGNALYKAGKLEDGKYISTHQTTRLI